MRYLGLHKIDEKIEPNHKKKENWLKKEAPFVKFDAKYEGNDLKFKAGEMDALIPEQVMAFFLRNLCE